MDGNNLRGVKFRPTQRLVGPLVRYAKAQRIFNNRWRSQQFRYYMESHMRIRKV